MIGLPGYIYYGHFPLDREALGCARNDVPIEPLSPTSMMDRDTLVQAILDLENKRSEAVPDPDLAYELAHHVKPHIDRLAAFRNGNGAEVSLEVDDDIESLGAEAEAAAGDEATSPSVLSLK